ncbi:hypothetical protein DFJ74DRAFT_713419 [Hyaloraphidium curvatum]|nr:hypothetical protein DFJ74DRAFT_713419 [Hyaloraphidium curvatum]
MDKVIQNAVESTSGLYAIVLTDVDGVVILQAMRQHLFDGNDVAPMLKSVLARAAEQARSRSPFSHDVAANALAKQAGRMGFSSQLVFLASYEEAQVALASVQGGMVVVIASVEADPDVLTSLAHELGSSVDKIVR